MKTQPEDNKRKCDQSVDLPARYTQMAISPLVLDKPEKTKKPKRAKKSYPAVETTESSQLDISDVPPPDTTEILQPSDTMDLDNENNN